MLAGVSALVPSDGYAVTANRRPYGGLRGARRSPAHWAARRFLRAERQEERNWRVERERCASFADRRARRAVVLAYDVTFSAPKSVSILWATGDRTVRREILGAVDAAAVSVGVSYLEDHALFVRVKGRRRRGAGLLAGSYLHATFAARVGSPAAPPCGDRQPGRGARRSGARPRRTPLGRTPRPPGIWRRRNCVTSCRAGWG